MGGRAEVRPQWPCCTPQLPAGGSWEAAAAAGPRALTRALGCCCTAGSYTSPQLWWLCVPAWGRKSRPLRARRRPRPGGSGRPGRAPQAAPHPAPHLSLELAHASVRLQGEHLLVACMQWGRAAGAAGWWVSSGMPPACAGGGPSPTCCCGDCSQSRPHRAAWAACRRRAAPACPSAGPAGPLAPGQGWRVRAGMMGRALVGWQGAQSAPPPALRHARPTTRRPPATCREYQGPWAGLRGWRKTGGWAREDVRQRWAEAGGAADARRSTAAAAAAVQGSARSRAPQPRPATLPAPLVAMPCALSPMAARVGAGGGPERRRRRRCTGWRTAGTQGLEQAVQ